MKQVPILILLAVVCLSSLLPALSCSQATPSSTPQAMPKAIVVTTPSVGGALQIYGAAIGSIVEKYTKVVVSPQPTTGAAEATELFARNESQMAAIPGFNALATYTGITPFKKVPEVTRGFTGAYKAFAHFIVKADSSIKSIADLKGMRCMFDRPGEPIFLELYTAALKAYGLNLSDVKIMPALGYAEASRALREGTADATLQYSAVPSPQFLEMDKTTPIRLLPIEPAKQAEVLKATPYLVPYIVKGGTYSGTPTDTAGLCMPSGIVIRKDLSDEFGYAAIKAVITNIADLNAAHAQFKSWTAKDLAADPVIPYHAGVIKYYKEAGIMTPEWEKKHQELLTSQGQKS